MKLINTYNQILLEVLHMSHNARAWTDFIYNKVYHTNEKEIVIFGQEEPNLYEMFPVDYFVITINNDFGMGGAYDENESGYKSGKYYVYITVSSELDKYVLNHELRHAYEDYKRMSRGKNRISKSKEGLNLFSGDFSNLMTKQIYDNPKIKRGSFGFFPEIIRALYLTSKLEESAYSETVYDNVRWVVTNLRDVLSKNYIKLGETYPDKVKLWWDNFKRDVNIPILNKFNDYKEFLSWSDKIIKRRGNLMLKKYLKIEYIKNKKGE